MLGFHGKRHAAAVLSVQFAAIMDIVSTVRKRTIAHIWEEPIMRMFLSQVQGPKSEGDFAAGCAQILLPGLADSPLTAAPWTDGSGFYLHGFHDENPAGLVAEVASRAGWTTQTLFLWNLQNFFNLPGGRIIDCEMPHNKHKIHAGEPYKKCPIGHKITDNHQVPNCPVCSGVLT